MHDYILLIVGINAAVLGFFILRAIIKQGIKNASSIYPPKRMQVIYKRKLAELLNNKQEFPAYNTSQKMPKKVVAN